MLERVFDLLFTSLSSAVGFTENIIAGMEGADYFVAVFIFVLAIELFIMPVRGGQVPSIGEFTAVSITPKRSYVPIYKNRLGSGRGFYLGAGRKQLPEARKQLPEARKQLPPGRLALPPGK